MLAVGLHGVFDKPVAAVPGRADRIAELLADERWPWRPGLLRLGIVPGQRTDRPRKRRLPRAARLVLADALAAPEVSDVGTACSPRERDDHAWAYVDTGRHRVPGAACPFEVRASCRAQWMPDGRPIGPWITLLHELMDAVGAVHGVLIAAEEDVVHDEVFLITTTRDGACANPRWREIDRISGSGRARHGLGQDYVRHPRWGTYLRAEHVVAAGGREAIAAAVRPFELRDLGTLLYVQLTESPETAATAEGEAKQRAFAELLAPILVPPR